MKEGIIVCIDMGVEVKGTKVIKIFLCVGDKSWEMRGLQQVWDGSPPLLKGYAG